MQSRFVFKRATKVPTTIGLIVGDSLRVKNVGWRMRSAENISRDIRADLSAARL
jgi:hypothetical protein